MQIEIKIDEDCKEPKIIVVTDKMTEEINEVIKKLSEQQPQIIAGFKRRLLRCWSFPIFTVYMLQAVRYLPKQLTGSIRSVSDFMK